MSSETDQAVDSNNILTQCIQWWNKTNNMAVHFLEGLRTGDIDILDVLLGGWFLLAVLVVAVVSWHDSWRKTKGQGVVSGGRDAVEGTGRGIPGRSCWSESSPGQTPGGPGGEAGGETCRWVNSLVAWMYMHQSQAPGQLLAAWLKALNEQTRKRGSSVQVTFDRLKAGSLPPKFSRVLVEAGPRDLLTVTCQVEATGVAFVIFATQQTSSSVKLSTCDVAIDKLIGKVQCKVQCLSDELLEVTFLFDGKPDLSLTVRPQTSSKNDPVDLLVVEETVRCAIMGATTSVDLSTKTVPREVLTPTSAPINMTQRAFQPPTNANVRSKLLSNSSMGRTLTPADRRLLVKVIKANGLREREGMSASDPYCVIMIDQPTQKHKTNIIRNTVNPFWDEHFLFELNNYSNELRFEVYDRDRMLRDEFLGEAVICLDSLERNPSSRQIIPLQGRLSERDNIKGSLTVEFLFMEPADQVWMDSTNLKPAHPTSPSKRVETQRTVASDGTIITTVTTTTTRPKAINDRYGPSNEMPTRVLTTSSILPEPQIATFTDTPPPNGYETPAAQRQSNSSTMTEPELLSVSSNPGSVAETAIKHLSESSTDDRPRTPTKKSTLIIHGVNQTPTEDFLLTDDPLESKEGSFKRESSPRGSKRRFLLFKKKDKDKRRGSSETPVNGSTDTGSLDSRKARANTLDVPKSSKSRESSPSRAKKRVFSFLKKDKKDKGHTYSSSGDLQNGSEPSTHRPGESPSPTTPSSMSSSLSVPGAGRSSSTGDLKVNKTTETEEEQRRGSSDTRQTEQQIGSPV